MATPGDHPEHTPSPTNDMLKYFKYEHLPAHLKHVSRPFADLAHWVHHSLPAGAETTTAMRKLLEAKDCAVRAAL
ncbi:hypothetical protein [Nocardiopsis ganjiahuensis]|uniref:hypothetical protein n=1 Tax=Nocardiopsis ganjiahuensis TaxID=239984 RepID=UPI00034B78A4|nr:hypothetical protein [Nocardiopsis ganjiahuensis]